MIIDKPFDGIYDGIDVEKELAAYLKQLNDYCGGHPYIAETRRRKKIKIPEGYNIPIHGDNATTFRQLPLEKQKKISKFWEREDRRMRNGYEGMCGLQYSYYNHGKLRGGKTREGETQYRRNDNEFFHLVEACIYGDNDYFKGFLHKGILEVGRRRSGKSSKIGQIVLELLRRHKDVDILVTSKTEDDADRVIIGDKVQYMYQKMPLPLKPSELKTNNGELYLAKRSKDEAGNTILKGRNSRVFSTASKPEGGEGSTIIAWIHDEGPKTPKFMAMFLQVIEALNDADGWQREGFFYGTGVAGDFDKFGTDYITIWNSAPNYQLIRWFTPMWVGLEKDEFGNENIELAVRKELTERHSILNNKSLRAYDRELQIRSRQQKFPLTVQEAFLSGSGNLFDVKKINQRKQSLIDDPVHYHVGDMEWASELKGMKATFCGNELGGRVTVLEPPQSGGKYGVDIDCYGVSQIGEGSDGVAIVFKYKNTLIDPIARERTITKVQEAKTNADILEAHLMLGHLPVAIYQDRPKDPKVFADRTIMLGIWYSQVAQNAVPVKFLPETQPSTIFDYMLTNYPHLLMPSPLRPDKVPTRMDLMKKGIDMKGYWAEKRLEMLQHYFEHYLSYIYFMEILEKAPTYDPDDRRNKHDIIDALGISLIRATDPRILTWISEAPIKEVEEDSIGLIIPFRRGV